MRKTSLLVVAIAATGLLWCLDRGVGFVDAAGECDCACRTVSVRGTIGEDGTVELTLPAEASPDTDSMPLLRVYQRGQGAIWGPADWDIYHGSVVTVYGEPGTYVMVVALKH